MLDIAFTGQQIIGALAALILIWGAAAVFVSALNNAKRH